MVGCWVAQSPTCLMEAIIASTSSWVQWLCHIQKTACDSTWLSHICRLCHRASSTYSCEIQCNSFSNNRNYYLLFLWLWQNTPKKATQWRKGYFSTQFRAQPITATEAWSSCSMCIYPQQETEQQMFPSAQLAFWTLHRLGPPAEGLVSCTVMWVFRHQALQPR